MELIHNKTRFDFVCTRSQILAFSFSGLLTLLSLLSLWVQGLNLGIDFSGGTLVQLRFAKPPHLDQVRTALSHLSLGDVSIQEFGSPEEILIRVGKQSSGSDAQSALAAKMVEILKPVASEGKVELRRVEFVGPQVGSELVVSGLWAVFYSLLAILLFVAWRFEWRFAYGAILSLIHDVIITMGLFSFTQKEFTLVVLAAVLTIIGYSINDTIVVFDRVREERIRSKKQPMGVVINRAINDTLSRTIIVSLTVVLVLIALLLFGGLVIHDFALALFVGVVLGTYSSIFVACQIVLLLDKKEPVAPEQPTPAPSVEIS
ncbi:protein translocase subunit SecF [Candidatus Magnetaquicoccus inordinatus]|uniref:protein translocase subunit SecF n=1 Tax=Candidatus Magnetaquicoccus inordinatus TaxID=2496818 RepID=UPI00102CA0BE|nr:protein translocase subunit SecF [Candidatus Magnetaquicoccus inordinatus]